MEIPKTVKVAGYNYQVEHCDSPFPVDSQVCDGVHTFSEQKIKVAKTGTEVYQRTVFLHELVHTRVANHGPDFYAMMDRFMPGWKSVRKNLRTK